MFQNSPPVPNEQAIGDLSMGADLGCELFLAVGSGTVNDLTRYVSAVAGKDFCVVGTAPSMDGYISGGSALIYRNTKTNFETHSPKAAFFDPDILGNAPRDMIAAGVGDLLGKVSCLTDWQLSKIVTEEWHCDFISDLVNAAIDQVVAARDGIAAGDGQACATLLEALLLSGVGMDYAENSRPASGCEHHLSHFWEMRYLQEGREAVFHGTKVGIGTVITLKAYAYIAQLQPDFATLATKQRKSFDQWATEIRNAFGEAADQIIQMEKSCGKNSSERLSPRLAAIEANWETIRQLAAGVMPSEEVEGILQQLNAPTKPHHIGVPKEMARQAIMYAKELRDRYTVLQLLWDLDELENFADMVISQYYPQS